LLSIKLESPELLIQAGLACVPAVGAAFFSASSAALSALTPIRKAALVDSLAGSRRNAMLRYLSNPAAIETDWLVLRGLGVSASAVLLARTLPWHPVLVTALVIVVYSLSAEMLSAVARRRSEALTPFLLLMFRPFELLVWPLSFPLSKLGRTISGLIEGPAPPSPSIVETEMELLVNQGEMSGSLAPDQSEMIRNALAFSDIKAGDLMIPRTQVIAVDVTSSLAELLELIAKSEQSRYPVYKDRIDNVVGVLHVKDVMTRATTSGWPTLSLSDLMRTPVMYVPESQPASSVLTDMRAGKQHMAIVIDEFGGMSGIITLEDLVEEIVGDIRDEHDTEEPPISDLGNGRLLVDASIPVTDLSRYLGVELPADGDYNSLGGLLIELKGFVPQSGATVEQAGLQFLIREADERLVKKVEIIRPTDGNEPPNSLPAGSVSTRPAA
jgi:CBS domain containing-hemolysin-like protein